MDDFNIEGGFPGVVTANKSHLSNEEFLEKISQNKPQIESWLLKHGALLFRNTPVATANQFSDVIESLNLGQFVNYIGGDSPRDKVEKKVYTSTEAPPSFKILLHQELSFIKNYPKHIYFFCEVAPQDRGETIIADARRVYEAIDPQVKKIFSEKGLTYISHYYHRSKIMEWLNSMQRSHKSWREVFETDSKDEVEQKCLANEFDWRWLKRDWLEIKQHRPALIQHPETKETVWFNQAHLYDFNPRHIGWMRYLGAKLFYSRKSTLLHDVTFANGERIPRKYFYHILDVLQENTVAFPWKKGDVMVLDNILAMHGRAPFTGKRRILTGLTS